MKLDNFYALYTGTAPLYGEERSGALTPVQLGVLAIPSGRLGVSDGAAFEPEASHSVPPGDYQVVATRADVSPEQDGSHLRIAYLSLVLNSEASAQLRESGQTVPVDSGTVALFDAEAIVTSTSALSSDAREDLFESYCDELDAETPLPPDTAFLSLPQNGAGFALVSAGWGDGVYQLFSTEDSEGHLTGLHLDFGVGGVRPDTTPEDSAEPLLQAEAVATKPITTQMSTVTEPSAQEVDKLIKRIKNYRGFWIPFLPLGTVFIFLGFTTPAYFAVGLPFLIIAVVYSMQELQDRARLEKLGFSKVELERRLNK